MKLESLTLRNFRCFGPVPVRITFERGVTAFVGGNGSGKTAVLQAMSRLFGVAASQRTVRRQDFHLAAQEQRLQTGAALSIEAFFFFPELEDIEEEAAHDAVPEFFSQMAASEPDAPLKVRMKLQAVWTDDGTPEGSVEEEVRWITTLEDEYEWDDCKRVQPVERGSIQLIYVPAARDAETQVTTLLKGRLWQAAKWSADFRTRAARSATSIQQRFDQEAPTQFVIERLTARWRQVHEADTDTTPILRLVETRLEELVRRAEFAFHPDEAGQERVLADLSDGQRSLFHIALTAATLEVERDALALAAEESSFEQEKLRRAHLTLLAIEEPENSLSPFFLSRIIGQAREIGAIESAQVVLSSHSPAILGRLEPQEVRYFRLDRRARRSDIRQLTLPQDDPEASQYVRLAVRAYPELYFARFVILAEGDSERLVIPRLAEAMDVPLDPSFVPVVPLAGRYSGHFWTLLSDLDIPFVTLLDLDLGRAHGGANLVKGILAKLQADGCDLSENACVRENALDPADIEEIADEDLSADNAWLHTLRSEGVYFSWPLDLDFSMLSAFPEAYQVRNPGGRGPRRGAAAIREKKLVTLKTGGKPDLYDDDYNAEFTWYPYLFLNRSKPETHLRALSQIAAGSLVEHAPDELKALVNQVKEALGLYGREQ